MHLGKWLRALGLGQFETAFRDNAIDEAVLPDLTEDHLRELGLPLGARIKLLKAIAALPKETASEITADISLVGSPAESAERRQVTVMFSDLVGSTAMSTQMDPEDLRELISGYQKSVTEVVQGFGGYVAKYMGDGVLAYFGYPQAHEDDAERSVRAALKLIAEVAKLKTHTPLQTRVGIATGLVVVGDLVGSGEAQERGIVGETPNLAARLQALAEPNMVVIAPSTRKLLGNLFELQDLGTRELKGIAGRVQIWAALRTASVEGRFEALHSGDLTSFVGREEELELLLRRWSRAKNGEGQVVLLCGEPGIGKSRLTAALLAQLAKESHTRLRFFCSPQHTDSALYPIIGQLERAAGLAHGDAPQAKLDKFDALLAQSSTPPKDAGLLAELLSLPNDGRYLVQALSPEQKRQQTLEALLAQIKALACQKPVLMIFEDAHWVDPTSLELIDRVLERTSVLPVLVIITFRPEFEPAWIGQSHVTTMTINRLGRRDIESMIDRIIGNKLLPPGLREDMIDRTDGIPLFVEEMTKAIVEAESENEAQRMAAAMPSPGLAIPASLHASLMARLDRLGPAKEVAQIGSAIGREFSHELIEAVAARSRTELEAVLHRLISAGLLFRQGVPPHAKYLFKHALVQDAAYSTLLREPRRTLHARIARAIGEQFADVAENTPELLAHHYTEAGEIEKAAGFWGRAGHRSLARSALPEAIAQLSRALAQIAVLPSTPDLRREQMKLQVTLITPLIHVKGYAAPETKAAVDQARLFVERSEELGEQLEDPLFTFVVLYGQWVANFVAFNGDRMLELASRFLALAEKRATVAPLMVGHRLTGMSLMHTGELVLGRKHLDDALRMYDPSEHHSLADRFGQDVRTAVLSYRALAHWILGYPDAALADADEAVKKARELDRAPTLAHALFITSFTLLLCGRSAIPNLEEVASLAAEKGASFWKAIGMTNQGCALALTGKGQEAVSVINSGLVAFRSTGSTLFTTWHLTILAGAYAELGQFADAWRCIDEALLSVRTTKERWCEADIYRMAGYVTLLSPRPDAGRAEENFARALAIARSQAAKSWELRAATSMARLWRDQGKLNEARELLVPIYDWFTEGFDTPDLQDAKALLDELR